VEYFFYDNFCSARSNVEGFQDEDLRSQVVNSLAFSSDEDSFKRFFTPKISQTMEDQLRISHDQLTDFQKPLPSSLNEVKYEKRRAIVVTEMQPPFKIVYVNSAWESLCGWTHPECVGKTLSLLQGKETDLSSVTSLLVKVLHGEEAGVVLTNYTKGQRRFRNHLRVRPMDDNYFVGVLREIHDGA
jgi:PAS domain S-box-containing protein